MITLLAKLFIKDNLEDTKRRERYGILTGIVGIFLNIILFGTKLLAGLLSNSVSIMADAINNLSDAGSSVITLIGFKIAGQKADSEHPYGHGRVEYLAGFMVSAIIVAMGLNLLKESVTKIFEPVDIEGSKLIIGILIMSIMVKAYMAFYNFSIGKRIDSATLRATAKDSMGDCLATTAVLISTIVSMYKGVNLDGYCGCIVSLFVLYAGYSSIEETLNPLLGTAPDKEYVDHVGNIVVDFDENILGYHDLLVHDYGPGRKIISLHAEVPADGDIMKLHDIIDNLEKQLNRELGCIATIHLDPIVTNDPEVNELRKKTKELVQSINEEITLHDFRVVKGDTHTNLIFDIVVPFSYDVLEDELTGQIRKMIKETIGENYFAVIEVDRI